MKTTISLSTAAIREFREAYTAEFGEDLTDEQIREIATNLLQFFHVIRGREKTPTV